MLSAAGQVPDHQGIDGPRGQLAPFCSGASPGDIIEDPGDLGCREIRVKDQPGAVGDPLPLAVQPIADGGRSAVLPDQGRRDRPARRPLPDNRRLALIRQSNSRDPIRFHPRVQQGPRHLGAHRGNQGVGIVLDPSGTRVAWQDLSLTLSRWLQPRIVQDRSRAGRSLVDHQKMVACHEMFPVDAMADRSRVIFRSEANHGKDDGLRTAALIGRKSDAMDAGLIIPLCGIMMPLVLVPTIILLVHRQKKREWYHQERLRALDMCLPASVPDRTLGGGTVVAIGAGVPIAAVLTAWMTTMSVSDSHPDYMPIIAVA